MKRFVIGLTFASLLQAETLQFTEYVSVRSSNAEYQSVSQRVPYQECYNQQVAVSNPVRQNQNVAGSVLGGAIGGVIGHQIGEGQGKDIATVGGAILGTIVGGNTIGAQPQQIGPRYETRRNCVTKYRQSRSQRQFVGYKNVAYYKGKKIVKYSNERLSSIPITVTIDY